MDYYDENDNFEELSKQEDFDIRRLPCFREPGSYEAFVSDMLELHKRYEAGLEKTYTSEEVWAGIDEMIENARVQNNLSESCAKGA